ncbi:MAG: class I SAM-dependent methyltransferase [Candidatus Levybacteria bacterium]|nr:class I SAM-dependent methyltransferase [Candidatus Levybacteria bacterium]
MPAVQTLKNKKGEVLFRQKLFLHASNTTPKLPYQPTKKEYSKIIMDRVNTTRITFQNLLQKGIPLSPFLEIGSERGQRSLLLTNEFGANGFMCDISLESLLSAKGVMENFNYTKLPVGVCADAYNLPFRAGSIPFIFCFQTIHHFPDPYPIFKEIKRVLAPGGYFYFNEEPIKQRFNLNLFRRDYHLRWYEKILKKLLILHFISRIGKSETDHNIIETSFPLTTWQRSIDIFDGADITVTVFPFGPTVKRIKNKKNGWINFPLLVKLMLASLGGNIEGLCYVNKKHIAEKKNKTSNILACPNCKRKPKLLYHKLKKCLSCPLCMATFENKHGVFILVSGKQKKALYN